MEPYRNLRMLTDSYQQVQRLRIAIGGRISAQERGSDDSDSIILGKWHEWQQRLLDLESEIAEEMQEEMQFHPAWPFLSRVKGIGYVLGGQLVGLIGDIGDFATISKLWRFSVGAPFDGKVEKPVKGQKRAYSTRLKKLLYVIGSSFLRSNSPYRRIYDEAKEHYAKERDWTPLHIHYAAMRKMEKVFLAHLWLEWRQALGLPISQPYILAIGGHSGEYKVAEFVEPQLK